MPKDVIPEKNAKNPAFFFCAAPLEKPGRRVYIKEKISGARIL